MPYYLDSSAVVKLVAEEPESESLAAWLDSGVIAVTSTLARTEVGRAVRRRAPEVAAHADAVLAALNVMRLELADYATAAALPPLEMRSLDALHLVAALRLGPELDGLCTYDRGQAAAATALGVRVVSPGKR
jgi:predicted nucleic acid-binding protein